MAGLVWVACLLLAFAPREGVDKLVAKLHLVRSLDAVFYRDLHLSRLSLVKEAPPAELIATYVSKSGTDKQAWSIHANGLDLNERDLQNADFYEARLVKAHLEHAQLQHAVLQGADLRGADLKKANLNESDLRWAQMQGADLGRASLDGANLEGAQLQGAILAGASLNGASLAKAILLGVDMNGAVLHGADLRDAQLLAAQAEGAQFHGADLEGAEFQGANFGFAEFVGASLRGVSLWRTNLSNTDISKADIAQARVAPIAKATYENLRAQLDEAVGGRPWQDVTLGRVEVFQDDSVPTVDIRATKRDDTLFEIGAPFPEWSDPPPRVHYEEAVMPYLQGLACEGEATAAGIGRRALVHHSRDLAKALLKDSCDAVVGIGQSTRKALEEIAGRN